MQFRQFNRAIFDKFGLANEMLPRHSKEPLFVIHLNVTMLSAFWGEGARHIDMDPGLAW